MAPSDPTAPAQKVVPNTTAPTPSNNTSSQASLSGLPPELRNRIYDLVVNDIRTLTVSSRRLIPHALARTCQQLRKEFFPVFKHGDFVKATKIKAHVRNLDFGLLSEVVRKIGMAKRAARGSTQKCNVDILLSVKSGSKVIGNREKLKTWRNLCLRRNLSVWFSFEYDAHMKRGGSALSDVDAVRRVCNDLELPTKFCPCELIQMTVLDAMGE